MISHVTRTLDFDSAKKRRFRAAGRNAHKRKEYDFSVTAKHAMPDRPVTVEHTDWNENGITFAYAAETSTRPFTNNVQEWKEY